MKKILFIFILAFSLTVSAQVKKIIPFQTAKNYFVNNTFKVEDLKSPKITSALEFEKIFGMAAHMGADGIPTKIDFTKQFVIAVINHETDFNWSIEPISLELLKSKKIKFTYKSIIGDKMTYTIIPFTFIIVDRKYKDYKIVFNVQTDKLKIIE